MPDQVKILIADDNVANVDILERRLSANGYHTVTAFDGEQALEVARTERPDLILLDIMMPKVDGIQVCRELKSDGSFPFTPIIIVSAKSESGDIVAALEAGADEYLTKPVDQMALVARVKSMLRTKMLHDQTVEQKLRLETLAAQLEDWNKRLQERVDQQLSELQRVSQFKRFFSPQIAEIIASDNEQLLDSHRRDITVVFCDLRDFTAFSMSAEPEDVMDVLRDYHRAIGASMSRYEAALEHVAGDGLMLFFNDPVACDNPAERAVRMALTMREDIGELTTEWRKRDIAVGFGVGVASGYATLGQIAVEGQFHYAAIGTVANLASRLCDAAKDGEILVSHRVSVEVEDIAHVRAVGELELKGFHKSVPTFAIEGLRSGAC